MPDYYVILGVPRDASAEGIRSAFRRLAKCTHPDRSGGGRPSFEEVREAYEVLSDPERRRRYNRATAGEETARPAPARRHRPRRSAPEPLVPEPMSVPDDFAAVRPGVEPLLARVRRNFSAVAMPKAERAESLTVQVALSPAEAARGVDIPLALPTFAPCERCGGSGHEGLFPCLACGQEGLVEGRRTVHVRIPPGVRHGAVTELPLDDLGIRNLYLRLQVVIDRA